MYHDKSYDVQDSKLIQILQTFTEKDLKQLDTFLQSPFFVEKNSKEWQLFTLLKKYHPTYSHRKLTKEWLFQSLFPKNAYKALKINQVMSNLVKLMEQFIYHYQLKQNNYTAQVNKHLALIEYYIEKEQVKWVEAQKRTLTKLQKDSQQSSTDFHYYQYQIETKLARLNSQVSDRKKQVTLDSTIYHFSVYHILNMLSLGCMHYTNQKSFGNITPIPLIQEIFPIIDKHDLETIPAVKVHKAAVLMLQEETEKHYQNFKALLQENLGLFPYIEARNLLTIATNYALGQLLKGNKDYYLETFELYELSIQSKTIYRDGKIRPSDLKNIITLGLWLKKYDWTEQFLKSHKNKILSEHQSDIYNYNLANIFFHQQTYEAALDLLRFTKFEDFFYELGAKRLEIKIMYELKEDIVLDSKLNAFKVFIFRNKSLSQEYKTLNNNFVRLLSRMIKVTPGNTKQIERLKKSFDELQTFSELNWLKLKLEELSN